MSLMKYLTKTNAILDQFSADGAYISSTDNYLNEYVPTTNCQRYYLSNFSGSTAELLITKNCGNYLFVDGRYHEQADLEVESDTITVEKVPSTISIQKALILKIQELGLKKLIIDSHRTSYSIMKEISLVSSIVELNGYEIDNILPIESYKNLKNVNQLAVNIAGESPFDKVQRVLSDSEAYFLTALDAISWITNCRGFHIPFQSTFLAKALVLKIGITIFIDSKAEFEINVKDKFLNFERIDFSKLKNEIERIDTSKIDKVYFDKSGINSFDFLTIKEIFQEKICEIPGGLSNFHSIKNDIEIKEIKDSFKKSSSAIFKSTRWVKESVKGNKTISELDLYHKVNDFYKKEGARDQSFGTIAAVGANSSIIHFSDPDSKREILKDDLVLLDSGGLYENGYATDTTRTVLAGNTASEKQKEVYTLVLKGFLRALNAIFPEGTWGAAIDILARGPINNYGYNFAHGVGHGVGINVHEGGIRLSPRSNTPLIKGQIVSIEPGLYIPGFGGVRLEDVVVVKKHKEFEGMLCFESLVYIGFDDDLIDQKILSEVDKKYLEDYQKESSNRGFKL